MHAPAQRLVLAEATVNVHAGRCPTNFTCVTGPAASATFGELASRRQSETDGIGDAAA
jgi:hypothetical protein